MGAGQAAAILRRRATPEERAAFEADYADRLLNPYIAAERGFIDAVIDPAHTRAEVAAALEILADKREILQPRKHGNEPLLRRSAATAACARLTLRQPVRTSVPHEGASPLAVSDEGKNVPDTITITDDRTGKTVTAPITDGVFPSARRSASSTATCSSTTRPSCRRRRASPRSRTSTATTASCATAAIRSSSSPSTRPTSRSPTSCSTANCPTKRSSRRGPTTSPTTRSSTRTCASGSSTGSTTTPTRWGCSSRRSPRSAPSTPTSKDIYDPRRPAQADPAA